MLEAGGEWLEQFMYYRLMNNSTFCHRDLRQLLVSPCFQYSVMYVCSHDIIRSALSIQVPESVVLQVLHSIREVIPPNAIYLAC